MELRLMGLFAAAVLGVGCQIDERPVDPVWGKQPCAHCHMLLSDPASAAQLVGVPGQPLYFDDIGCAVEHQRTQRGAGGQIWVRDPSGAWRSALDARYGNGHRTPMGYGIAVQADGPLDFAQVQREIALKRTARSDR